MKNYLIHIQLTPRNSGEIKQFGLALQQILQSQANAHQHAYSTPDKFLSGYFVQSNRTANQLRMAIDGNQPIKTGQKLSLSTGFTHNDSLFVIELGDDISENGFNTIKTWLNRHPAIATSNRDNQK